MPSRTEQHHLRVRESNGALIGWLAGSEFTWTPTHNTLSGLRDITAGMICSDMYFLSART